MHDELIETLRLAQRLGFFGEREITEAVAHAQWFVEAIGDVAPGGRIVDLGSGGGLPGLVVADARPDAVVVLVDRRRKRTDFLERAVSRLGWSHVTVVPSDARRLAAEVAAGRVDGFDVVTARGFGPPELTLRMAVSLSRSGARIVISEPPSGDRWADGLLTELGLTTERIGAVRRFDLADPTRGG